MSATRDSIAAKGRPSRRLAAVRGVSDEREYLYELIQTIGAGPDLEAILRGVVQLVTEATTCHACFVYFLADGILELRAASGMYADLEGKVRIPLGEGLTGWVVQTRRSAFIKEGALKDPRVRRAYFPELGDEVYESLVSVPIFARSGDPIGAITLHAEAPHEFGRPDLDFLEHTASLVAGAIENARLYEEATERVELLTDLSSLSRDITSAQSADEVAAVVAEGLRRLLRADRCDLYLLEPDERLTPRAASPPREGAQALDTRTLWSDIVTLEPARATTDEARRLADLVWGREVEGRPLFAPIVAGPERIGLIAILASETVPDAGPVLGSVAAQTAVALKQHQVIERLRERNLLKDLFQALTRRDSPPEHVSDLASRLGCDIGAPHLVLRIVPWTPPSPGSGRARASHRAKPLLPWTELAGQFEGKLAARFPGILIDHVERSLRAMIPCGPSDDDALTALRKMDWGGGSVPGASVGVSNPCSGARAFARGFEEAESAAEVGALLRGMPGLTAYEDLGPYRYVLDSQEKERDRLQQRLERLLEYDARRGAGLLDTLEGYLDHRGNVARTSRALYIHSNTLRQRLERIERLSGIDLEREDWLSLAVATKVAKLRRMRSAAGKGGADG